MTSGTSILRRIDERASDILFHFTSLEKAANACRKGEFNLTYAIGADKRKNKKPYYLSLSRVRNSGFWVHNAWSAVLFEVSGKRLNHNFEVQPFDYWELGFAPERQTSDEQEDRLFHTEPSIPLWKFLRKVHIFLRGQIVGGNIGQAQTQEEHARFIKKLCDETGVPCFVYKDVKAWRLGDERKAVSLEWGGDPDPLASTFIDRYHSSSHWDLPEIVEFLKDPHVKVDQDPKMDKLDKFIRSMSHSDWEPVIKHRLLDKKSSHDPKMRNALYQIVQLERRSGRTIFELIKAALDARHTREQAEGMKKTLRQFSCIAAGEFVQGWGEKARQNPGMLEYYLDRFCGEWAVKTMGQRATDLATEAWDAVKAQEFERASGLLAQAADAVVVP